MDNIIERGAFNRKEAAQYLGISENTLSGLLKTGKIRFATVGRRLLIGKAELDRFLTGEGVAV